MNDADTNLAGQEISFALLVISLYGMMFFGPIAKYMGGQHQAAADLAAGFIPIWGFLTIALFVRHGLLYYGWTEDLHRAYKRYVQ